MCLEMIRRENNGLKSKKNVKNKIFFSLARFHKFKKLNKTKSFMLSQVFLKPVSKG